MNGIIGDFASFAYWILAYLIGTCYNAIVKPNVQQEAQSKVLVYCLTALIEYNSRIPCLSSMSVSHVRFDNLELDRVFAFLSAIAGENET